MKISKYACLDLLMAVERFETVTGRNLGALYGDIGSIYTYLRKLRDGFCQHDNVEPCDMKHSKYKCKYCIYEESACITKSSFYELFNLCFILYDTTKISTVAAICSDIRRLIQSFNLSTESDTKLGDNI